MPQQLPLLAEERAAYTTQRDDTDRAAVIEDLRAKLSDPTFRAIEGFPIGEDEAILALSDPPTYTACPNPFLAEIVAQWQEERRDIRAGLGLPDDAASGYSREPFAADVSEGKNDPTFGNAQFLPHQGAAQGDHALHPALHRPRRHRLRRLLRHGACVTGVAAQLCGKWKWRLACCQFGDIITVIYGLPWSAKSIVRALRSMTAPA